MCCLLFIVCFSEDDGPGQGGLHEKNHPVAAEWPGFRQTKLSDSQLRSGLDVELSSDQEIYFLYYFILITLVTMSISSGYLVVFLTCWSCLSPTLSTDRTKRPCQLSI